jgi:hypothetical protein
VRAVCALLLCACTGSNETAWSLRFVEDTAVDRAVIVEAILLRGGCRGDLIYRAEVPREGMGPMPPALGRGRYGFAGVARDASCRPIARGCAEAELPLTIDARVSVPLEPVDEPPACASGCIEGRCEGEIDADAGMFMAADGGVVPPCDRGRCYSIAPPLTASWEDAELACIAWGGHLAELDDAEEEAWILARASGALWIGLSDAGEEQHFVWTEGDSAYRRWISGAPRTNPGWRDCVAISDDGWEDRRCTDALPYVCERAE